MKRRLVQLFTALFMLLSMTACSGLFGSLRSDYDEDQMANQDGSSGGMWPERGILDGEDPDSNSSYDYIANDRDPANSRYQPLDSRGSWLQGEQTASNRRDEYRKYVAEGDGEVRDGYAQAQMTVGQYPQAGDEYVSKKIYKNGGRATRKDFQDDSGEGSLWADGGQANYYFSKNKVRGVGDIITLKTEPDLVRTVAAETKARLTDEERETEVDMIRTQTKAKRDQIKTSSAAPQNPLETPSRAVASADGQDATGAAKDAKSAMSDEVSIGDDEEPGFQHVNLVNAINLKPGDPMMAEIIERYPNGNYKVRASKQILYRNSKRNVKVLGIVKPGDIGDDDTVASSKLYEYRTQVYR